MCSYVSKIITAPVVKLDIKVAQSCKIKVSVIYCLTAPPFNKLVPSLFSFWVLFLFFFHQIKQFCFLSLMIKITAFLVWLLLRCSFDCLLWYNLSFLLSYVSQQARPSHWISLCVDVTEDLRHTSVATQTQMYRSSDSSIRLQNFFPSHPWKIII